MANIIWKNIDSDTVAGLLICELPPISKPKMKTTITKIDGRDGDIIEELGYESYTKNIKIGLTKNYDIDAVIKYFTGEGDLILSNEPNKIYKCRIIDKIDYEKLLRFKTAVVKFHTQPYKYLLNESIVSQTITTETQIEVVNSGLEISKPIITIEGSGTVEISINNSAVFRYTFPEDETKVVIDSLQEEAYLNEIFKNRNMVGNFPKLEVGTSIISWTGTLSKITIEPKSRWL